MAPTEPLAACHLLDGRYHCGASLVTKALVSAMHRADHDARLFCLYEGPVAQSVRDRGQAVAVVPGGSTLARWRGLVSLLQGVRAEGRLPIIHSHQLRTTRFASFASRRCGRVPHVISVHTHKEEFIRDHFRSPVKRQVIRAIHYWMLNRANGRVAVSPGVLRELRERGHRDENTLLVRNITPLPEPPADTQAARAAVRAELDIADGAFVVMAAGRFVPLKRFDLLLANFAELAERLEGTVLVLAGDGPLRCELEQQAAGLGIANAVRFPGWIRDLVPIITACDCAVSASKTECSPVFLIEAMALQRPVVAAAAEDVANLVEDGTSGILFPLEGGAMCDAVVSVARDPDLAGRLGAAARVRVQQLFDEAESVRDMLALYDRVAASAPTGSAS